MFNFEGESTQSAEFATYPTLPDMLSDTNRTGVFVPNAFGVGRNIVGSGASILAAPRRPRWFPNLPRLHFPLAASLGSR